MRAAAPQPRQRQQQRTGHHKYLPRGRTNALGGAHHSPISPASKQNLRDTTTPASEARQRAQETPPQKAHKKKICLVVQEPRHLSAPEGGDLSSQTVPEPDVVEPRHRGGDVLVELPEDGLACRVQPEGGPGGEDVVTVVAPRRLLRCGGREERRREMGAARQGVGYKGVTFLR